MEKNRKTKGNIVTIQLGRRPSCKDRTFDSTSLVQGRVALTPLGSPFVPQGSRHRCAQRHVLVSDDLAPRSSHQKDPTEWLRNIKGFTLIEIMIVLAIVGMLFSFVGVNLMSKFKESKVQGAKIQIASLQQALQAYYLSSNMYPSTAQGLDALLKKPSVGKVPASYPDGGFLGKKTLPKDPWANEYRYVCEDNQNFSLSSMGPDGQPDTDDDIKGD